MKKATTNTDNNIKMRHQIAKNLLIIEKLLGIKDKTILSTIIDVLINPIEYLSPEELRDSYQIQQYNYDVLDIHNELDTNAEYYIEKFAIDKYPVSEKEVNDMASELRSILDMNADACWTTAKTEAVQIILEQRKIKN